MHGVVNACAGLTMSFIGALVGRLAAVGSCTHLVSPCKRRMASRFEVVNARSGRCSRELSRVMDARNW